VGRNNEDFVTGSYKYKSGDRDEYFTGTGENSIGTQSGAYLTVDKPNTQYSVPHPDMENYSRRAVRGLDAGKSDNSHLFGEQSHPWDDIDNDNARIWARNNADEKGNIPLFGIHHNPPVLDLMVATKDSTPQGTGLAAHAVEETRRNYGERPWASDNTSEYSTKFVNEAIKKGLIKGVIGQEPGTLAKVGNSMDWSDAASRIHNEGKSVMSMAEDRDEYYSARGRKPSPIDPLNIQTDTKNLVLEALDNAKVKSAKRPNVGRQFKQQDLFFDRQK
jgi:hypothetical protein